MSQYKIYHKQKNLNIRKISNGKITHSTKKKNKNKNKKEQIKSQNRVKRSSG